MSKESDPSRFLRRAGLVALLATLFSLGLWYWWANLRLPVAKERTFTVGVVQLTAVDEATFDGFRTGMTELGYPEGKRIRYRNPGPAGSIDRLAPMIEQQISEGVDLLFVSSTPATVAARAATATNGIPVVFAPVNDPVKARVVASLKSPGGNLTGIRLPQGDAMRLQWLLQVAPRMKRIVFPHNPDDASAVESLNQIRQASTALGIELLPQPVASPEAISESLRRFPARVDAILLPRDSSVESRIDDYVKLSLARRLPLCAPSVTQVQAGALVSHGFVHFEIGRQAARLADRIFQGVPPAELPVETARSYLAINLKTARALGIDIPSEVLRSADILVR
jgi:putative ABC transport system substrate-binding protein